jgi:glycosyltransferase involved in cell wall biosynthesis
MSQLRTLIKEHGVENKVETRGMLPPEELWKISQQARIGVALAENTGLNQYLALPNKFFDYIQAGLPQVTMDYPEYRAINAEYEVAVLVDDLAPLKIAAAINNLLDDTVLFEKLRNNCLAARQKLNWQEEEKKLLAFYESILPLGT